MNSSISQRLTRPQKQAALEELKKSLLHQAFTGELWNPAAMSRIFTNADN
jgi:hypothetical protein